jgi:hypothetical protein
VTDPKRRTLDYTNRLSVLERRRMLMRQSERQILWVIGAVAVFLFAWVAYAVLIHQC